MNEINKLNYSAIKQDFHSNTNKFLSFSFGQNLRVVFGCNKADQIAKNSADHVSHPTEKLGSKPGGRVLTRYVMPKKKLQKCALNFILSMLASFQVTRVSRVLLVR